MRTAYAWSALLLAIALALLLTRHTASLLAFFPLYFALVIAWTQYRRG